MMRTGAKEMIKAIFSEALRVGRTTALAVGVALMVALTVGLASAALAGTGVGARFDLGKTNAVNAVSKLVGSVAGPSLRVDNNSADASATALDLQVESGKAPMKVDSDTRVTNLNADELDDKDSAEFLSSEPYQVNADGPSTPNTTTLAVNAVCDEGDIALSGGFAGVGFDTTSVRESKRLNPRVWTVRYKTGASADSVRAEAYCWDLPPLRPDEPPPS